MIADESVVNDASEHWGVSKVELIKALTTRAVSSGSKTASVYLIPLDPTTERP